MSDAEKINLDNISVDEAGLYREEMITDLKAASIQVLTPIKVDGSADETRQTKYVAQTQLMSRAGVLPVTAHIEADSLADALSKFPEAIKEAVDRMVEEAREMQRQEASRIVVPSIDKPGPIGGGGSGITLT